MPVISNKRVAVYLEGFSDKPFIQGLLRRRISPLLQKDQRCLRHLRTLESLQNVLKGPPSTKLLQAFEKSAEPWYAFEPNKEVSKILSGFVQWLEDEFTRITSDVRGHAEKQLYKLRTLDDIAAFMQSPLLTPEEIELQRNQRQIPQEEQHRHIRFMMEFPNKAVLVHIQTKKGMIMAGKNADNCLGSTKLPKRSIPHRFRVNHPDRWLYFSIRDKNNKSLLTIGVDVETGKFSYERNKQNPIQPEDWELLTPAKEKIMESFPALQNARPHYGTGHMPFQRVSDQAPISTPDIRETTRPKRLKKKRTPYTGLAPSSGTRRRQDNDADVGTFEL